MNGDVHEIIMIFDKSLKKEEELDKKRLKDKEGAAYKYLVHGQVFFLSICFVLLLIVYNYPENNAFNNIVGGVLLVAYIYILLFIFFTVAKGLLETSKSLKNPFGALKNGIDFKLSLNENLLKKLESYSIVNLKSAIIYLESESLLLSKRFLYMFGSVTKLGVFPGLVVTFMGFYKSRIIDSGDLFILSFFYLIIYLIGVKVDYMLSRTIKVLSVAKLAIEIKEYKLKENEV